RRLLEVGAGAAAHGDLDALLGQHLRARPSQALAGAADDRDFVLQLEIHGNTPLALPQAFLNAPSRSTFINACTPVLKVGPPPGTAADWIASSSSRLVAPCSMARRMWATTPSCRPRKARIPMMTISRCLTESSLPSPMDRSLRGCRALKYSGSSFATQSQQG